MINKYQWHDEVERAFTNKLLTLSAISKISKHLYELAQKTDDNTKKELIKKQLKYKEICPTLAPFHFLATQTAMISTPPPLPPATRTIPIPTP